jgi:putative oxidoreductase
MASKSITSTFRMHPDIRTTKPMIEALESPLRFTVPLGRVLFAAIFLMASLGHFSAQEIGYASQQGVPFASVLVPFSGVLALMGGLSVLLGYRARLGALLLLVFLVPVTLMLHRFWGVADPMQAQIQLVNFMKNVSMMGTTLLIAYFGAGPLSLDSRREAKLEQSK